MNCLILSKNRACQLHLLLETLNKYSKNLVDQITVIYLSTDDNYKAGYKLLQSRNLFDNITWQKDTEFYSDFLSYMKNNDSELFLGITDDCVLYKQTNFTSELLSQEFQDPDLFCASLRLGLNTKLQDYVYWQFQPELTDYLYNNINGNSYIQYNWRDLDWRYNYGYPISLDGHIFRTKEIYDLSTVYPVNYLRSWEGVLASHVRKLTTKSLMLMEEQSSLYCIPANCVQTDAMFSGIRHAFSTEELNNKYLQNQVIDTDCLITENVIWSHIEVPFTFKNYEN